MSTPWFHIQNEDDVCSPAFLVYPDRVLQNIQTMLSMVKGPEWLRPHIKTHKMKEVVEMCLQQGITKFKAATPAEAELLGLCRAPDALLAYPAVGPTIQRIKNMAGQYPATHFSVLVDHPVIAQKISDAFSEQPLSIWLDIDCGMHRTGMALEKVPEFLHQLKNWPGLKLAGLHVYDGHIHDADLATRRQRCAECFDPVYQFLNQLPAPLPLIAGGSPTFPIHAAEGRAECSPGTPVFWDFSYEDLYPEMGFVCAAMVLTRVVGHPGAGRLCLDLGHKSIASENPHPRVRFPQLPEATVLTHSEEHLVLATPRAEQFPIGTVLYGIPRHVCPTCALYAEATVVQNGRAEGTWEIPARARRIHF